MKLLSSVLAVAGLAFLSAPSFAADNQCEVTVEAGDSTKFSLSDFDIPQKSCPKFTLHFKHHGKLPLEAMGHNVVITRTADFDDVVKDGRKEGGESTDYLKPKDERVLAMTKMLGGGQEDTISIDTSKFKTGEDYTFFCSYPGHPANMHGKVNVLDK